MSFGVRHEWERLREAIVGSGGPEVDVLAALLEQQDVEVSRSALLSVRDPLIVVGDKAIDGSLRRASRQHERVDIARERIATRPGSSNEVDGPYIEGGDVLVNGREIYAGMSGRASDMAGIDCLETALGTQYRVIPMALRSSVLHLQDVLALVRPGLLVMEPDKLIDGLPMSLRSWEAIVASPELLTIDAGRVVVEAGNERLIEELRARRMEVIPLRFAQSMRAVVLALWRQSAEE